MKREGNIQSYFWVEDDDASLEDLLLEIKPLILGTRAINTSFDSGILGSTEMRLSECDKAKGWATLDNRAISPVIDELNFTEFLYTDSYDEWYFFKDLPKSFSAVAFCNFLGMSLARVDELSFDGGCNLCEALTNYKPIAVAGWNDAFSYYLVQEK